MSTVTKTVLLTLLGLLVFCILWVTIKVIYYAIIFLVACYLVGFCLVKGFKFIMKG